MERKVHFIGIGGIGMSALARYFLSLGWQVSGSDLFPSSITDELKKEGVKIYIGHKMSNVKSQMSKIIYSQAIPTSNIELRTAQKLGLPCQSYPEAVGVLTRQYKTIAIAGAHGKSTTTAMISLILIKAGFDPTVIIGTKLKELSNKNFRAGKSDWLVLEADEWKGSFWHYSPAIGAITNIDREHLDFYKTFANVKQAFQKFKKNCGAVIGVSREAKAAAAKIKKVLKIAGWHNVENAMLAYSIGRYLKIPARIILKALGQYRGAWRRMEYRGEFNVKSQRSKLKCSIFDDYAHHPTEIKATLAGFRQKWPKNELICVFQAHQIQRLKLLFNDFKTAFKAADKVIILPTYEVAGREKKAVRVQPLATRNLAERLAQKIKAIYLENPQKNLKMVLTKILMANPHTLSPIIVMMGAGDIVKYTDMLLS